MTSATRGKALREGSASKRTAILDAARELFVTDGFERASMDAIALSAGVSKRTVYDYFGDKRTLLIAVIERTGERLMESLREAIDAQLSDERPVRDAAELEAALTAVAMRITTTTMGSSDYAAVLQLVGAEGAKLPELAGHPLATAPEDAIAERLAHFDAAGILDAPDPRLAADHFNALTILLAHNQPDAFGGAAPDAAQSIRDGVHAFMRAYARR